MTQKIDGFQAPAVRGTSPLSPAQTPRAGEARDKPVEAAAAGDSLRLTGEAASLQALQRDMSTGPAVDEARVQAVRDALAAGTYRIDPGAIAAGMLDLDAQLGG
ncbi:MULTISPECIES: flagellar biosynthesis anti-sigma factor FlgM [Luteimonas]|uniref:flagellar biosynthesis anti-sigma factor FlgM n=1 Tax=Luteimonas TaxID=83614 RepID=UPI000C7E36A3|nr:MULTISPECIES: flagellar biosynthesis anti-sigma factor FlgM [Luteimonas]